MDSDGEQLYTFTPIEDGTSKFYGDLLEARQQLALASDTLLRVGGDLSAETAVGGGSVIDGNIANALAHDIRSLEFRVAVFSDQLRRQNEGLAAQLTAWSQAAQLNSTGFSSGSLKIDAGDEWDDDQ